MTLIRTTTASIFLGTSLLWAHAAQAASFFWVPSVGEYGISKEIVADLKIDSEGVGINAAQATIRFPKDVLEVKSIEKTDSAFSFWLEEPSFSNTDGAITFIGGTPYGVSGASIEVLRVTFTTKSGGTASISFSDAAITASDGSGTNVLSKTNDAIFTVSPEKITPVIIPPVQIIREPEPAQGLPVRPAVHVSLYPDPTEWYNVSSAFTAAWDLPRDISGVATALTRESFSETGENEGLFESKMYQALADGVWYFHIQFKNEIGWGPTTHYRLAVDTKTPLPFEITVRESAESDIPTPTLAFKTSDALSGLLEYQVRIDENDWIAVPAKGFKGSYKLPPQEPGDHRITVRAVDYAGNSIEDSVTIKTIPIASPVLTSVTDRVFTDALQGVTAKGTALPSTEVLLRLTQDDALIASSTVPVDDHGVWEYTFGDPLRNGTYLLSAQTRDVRGARSLVVTSPKIKVGDRPILQIGTLELGKGSVIVLLVIVLLGGFGSGYWFYKKRREKTSLRLEVAQGDTAKIFKMIKGDVEKLQDAQKTPTPADDEFAAEKLKKNVEKMGDYIQKEIDRAKE